MFWNFSNIFNPLAQIFLNAPFYFFVTIFLGNFERILQIQGLKNRAVRDLYKRYDFGIEGVCFWFRWSFNIDLETQPWPTDDQNDFESNLASKVHQNISRLLETRQDSSADMDHVRHWFHTNYARKRNFIW